ncbi:PilX N-terminal domain-containing pilus assembly protein [Halopseudomonas sp.]|uniref:PilX N-terminal domain-containing pilus assembly protein n=1 Tax=Halopseudomonas sp. TaxID=2901191 RepID=UPI00311D4ED2
MKGSANYAHGQRGVALVVALLVLLMVSVLGLSAMRSSVFSAKVATGVQSDVMTFEAAETVIVSTYGALTALSNEQLYNAVDGQAARYCMKSAGAAQGACGSTDFMDVRGLLQAESYSYLDGFSPISGSQVSSSGGAGVFVDYRINILGESEMDNYGIENHHLQETLKRGIKPGAEIN